MNREQSAPVQEGGEYEVWIESVGEKGDGIAKVKGFVLFIANTKKGDYVKVRVTKVLQNVGFAEVVKKLEKPERAKRQKFATVRAEELEEVEEESQGNYENTEDFGEELEEKE